MHGWLSDGVHGIILILVVITLNRIKAIHIILKNGGDKERRD